MGRLDVIINSAVYQGSGCLSRCLDMDIDDYKNMILCNTVTPLAIFKKGLEIMLKQKLGGALIQLSSSSEHLTPKFSVDNGGWDFGYASSKSAISKLMPLLSLEHPLKKSNIRFFNLEPGLVVTELMKVGQLDNNYTTGFGSVPPEVSGAVVKYLVTSSNKEIENFNGKSIYAPKMCEKKELIQGYIEHLPEKAKSKL